MADFSTHGFDVVIQISELEYDDQIAIMYAAGDGIFPAEQWGSSPRGTMHFLFDTPYAEFNTDVDNGIRLHIPFSESTLTIGPSEDIALEDIDGEIRVVHPVTVLNNEEENTARVILNFADGIPEGEDRITIHTDGDVLPDDAEDAIIEEMRTRLEDDVEVFDLLQQPIQTTDEPDPDNPLQPLSVEAKVIEDERSTLNDALAVLLRIAPDTAGNADNFTESLTHSSNHAAIQINTDLLLEHEVCPDFADSLELEAQDFSAPCELNQETTTEIDGNDITYSEAWARFDDGHIRMHAKFETSGWQGPIPYKASGSINMRLYFEIRNGELDTRMEFDDPDILVRLPAWAYGAAILTGGLTASAAIALITTGIVDLFMRTFQTASERDEQREDLVEAVNEQEQPDMGPLADGFEFDSVNLTSESLVIEATPIREAPMPIAARGHAVFSNGQAINLDNGHTISVQSGSIPDGFDLFWGVAEGTLALKTANSALMKVFDNGYNRLSVVDLEKVDYPESNLLPYYDIPRKINILGLAIGFSKALAVQTTDNRYAKCKIWRESNQLHLRFITYDRPIPRLEINFSTTRVSEEAIETGTDTWPDVTCNPSFSTGGFNVEGDGITVEHRSAEYTRYADTYKITCNAELLRLATRLEEITWTLDGHRLSGDSGTVDIAGHTVSYEIEETECILTTEQGKSLRADLCVEVKDFRDLTFSACKTLNIEGERKTGGMPPGAAREAEQEIARCLVMAERDLPPGGRYRNRDGLLSPEDEGTIDPAPPGWTDLRDIDDYIFKTESFSGKEIIDIQEKKNSSDGEFRNLLEDIASGKMSKKL